jgi:hypothetical protein
VGGDCGHQESRRRWWWKVLELFARWRAEFKPLRVRDFHHFTSTRWKKGTLKPPRQRPLMHFGGRGGMGLAAKAKATTWPLHGPTRPQHGRNRQNGELAFWFFCSKFLTEASKKIELVFRHSYLACLLSWKIPLPFRLRWL